MEDDKIVKICNNIFNNEIKSTRISNTWMKTHSYERELYLSSIKSFKTVFMNKIKKKFIK